MSEHNNYTQTKCCFFCKFCNHETVTTYLKRNENTEITYYCTEHEIGPSPVFVCDKFEWKQWVLDDKKRGIILNKLKFWFIILLIKLRIIKVKPIDSISWNYYYPAETQHIIWDDNVYQFKQKNNCWVTIDEPKIQNAMELIF